MRTKLRSRRKEVVKRKRRRKNEMRIRRRSSVMGSDLSFYYWAGIRC